MLERLEKKLLNDDLHIHGCVFLKKQFEPFPTHKKAKEFLICFLTLESISGVNYEKRELFVTYLKVYWLVTFKAEISAKELPYHREKKHIQHSISFVLEGCTCKIIPST